MSVPHLDTRRVAGKVSLLFGPYAGFSTKFLKQDRKSTRLNSSHEWISYAVFWLKKNSAPWANAIEERRAGPDWWSLQPLKAPGSPTPDGIPAAWSRSSIDRWVYSKLHEKGLIPS